MSSAKQSISIKNYLLNVLKGKFEWLSLERTLLFSFISIFLINLLTNALLSITSSPVTELFLTELEFDLSIIFISVVILLMPIYEELVFRLFLDPTPTKTLISTSLIVGLIIAYMVGNVYILSPFLLLVVLPIAFSPMISLLLIIPFKKSLFPFKRVSILSRLETAINKDIRPAYYISAILFSAAHIAFQKMFFIMSISIMIIMFMNYFLVGLVLGYMRITKGVIYAMIIHCLLNLLVYLNTLFDPH